MLNNIYLSLNIPLIIVGVAIAISIILGAVVILNDRKSITNITFLFFSISAVLWNVSNYIFYQPGHSPGYALLLLRLVVFFAIWYCFFLSQLFYVFPEVKVLFPLKYFRLILPAVALVSISTLTPIVFSSIASFDTYGRVATALNGFGIYIFGVSVVSIVFSGVFILVSKLLKTKQGSIEREQFRHILIGAIITFTLHIVFNMVLPAFFNISQFTALGAVFTLPFSIFTSFAIIKYRLFNVKVIATELITFALWLLLLMRALTSSSLQDKIIDVGLLLATIIVGVLLIRSVMKEVQQKEELEELDIYLQNLVKQRESLMHLVTHKVKGSFTRTKILFASMLDGTFGEITPEIKRRAQQGLDFDNDGVATVDLVLNAANMQSGTIKYEMKPIDFKEIVERTITEKRIPAENKGLKLEETEIKEGNYGILGDAIWVKEAVNNLIENSIKYTKTGSITVGLEKLASSKGGEGEKILLSVKDTGVGITDEDKQNLFKEGGRGKDSIKVNVDSTGYGLFTVKLVIESHKGRVWAESEGAGKGSQFYLELPVATA